MDTSWQDQLKKAQDELADIKRDLARYVMVPRWEYELMEKQRERADAAEAELKALKSEVIPARWDGTVILPEHPNGDSTGQSIVCCLADDDTKRPIGLFLDPEQREALGLILVDPASNDNAGGTR
ncbi:hypothetical protein [Streptomyces violaceus]|uniref:Uncharacterized protein n=1 Tax=Streptomyces violaceus TaxID=1936 RepID=A0ABY9UMP2_STRVL|nr:hypothetical protein [Streptomyces janthinus]WND24166.1 hypothetical protein RI060_43375 [Streptomyces janthinus]GGS96735.1 hypothetical protein GCM10010270_80870 [Streptomyces janthinus]